MKKMGVELSVNVIIIAAISLIVLVLLSFLVLRSGGGIAEGTSCESIGGNCVEDPGILENPCGDYARHDITKKCSKEAVAAGRTVCCLPLG